MARSQRVGHASGMIGDTGCVMGCLKRFETELP